MTNQEDKEIGKRMNAVKTWIKDPLNLSLALVIIFTIAIRVYYFIQTSGQALWWDEAEYGAMAKYFAGIIPSFDLNPQRPFMFPGLMALAFMIGLGETAIKFLFTLLPSMFLVFSVYLLGKELYSKKIGVIAAFLTSVSWTFLFWSNRLQPDFTSMIFQTLAIVFVWRYWNSGGRKNIIYSAIFASLGFQFKVSGLLVPAAIALFILIRERFSAFKNKDNWIFAAVFLIVLIPQFIYSYYAFGSATTFLTGSGYAQAVVTANPIGWSTLSYLYILTENPLYILFLIGLVLSLKFLLYLDIIFKDKKKALDAGLFSLIVIVVVAAFYIFYIRGAEDRWVFLWIPFMFIFAGKSLEWIGNLADKYKKGLGILIILLLLAFSGYVQVSHADGLIKNKIDSYSQVRDAGIWMKDNSNPEDKILSISLTQTSYYSERNVTTYSPAKMQNESDFERFLKESKPKFIQLSVFEPHPQWIFNWTQNNQNRIKPVYGTFSDAAKKQASLIVYEFSY